MDAKLEGITKLAMAIAEQRKTLLGKLASLNKQAALLKLAKACASRRVIIENYKKLTSK